VQRHWRQIQAFPTGYQMSILWSGFTFFFFAISSFLRFFFFSLSRIYGVTTHDTASTVALNKGCYRTCRRRSDWILHRLLANHPANQWVGMLLC
jgi:hypothetical protein